MRTDKIRKYVLPNIPYLFIGWACLKMGAAYRLAAGANFGEKLLGLMQTIGVAFADFSPGLDPFDWLIGIVGAVAFRLLIYFKSKNAKKYRRDEEYGSSRWGCPKDIQPFVDPKFENNVILTGTELLTMNTRPKNPANARNLNACIIGSSGSGKTRFWLTPQLLQAHSSYVVVDPKGGVLGQVGRFLQKRRYKIKVFNSIDFSKSMHYNPLAYIKNEADILKFVNALISNTKGEGKEGDPFWTKAETLLYPTMSINELCALPVAELAAPDSALFLWATFPQLPEALRLIEAWGFTYKSVAFVWLKKNRKADSWFYGLGFWTRGNAEICLLATRGHPKRQAANVHQFIISPIEAHSKKPDEARDKIVSLMGDLPRVELFARQTPPGWDVWGNEVEPTIRYFGTKCPEVQKGN